MKAVILAGGFGSRISEETGTIPKPMIAIGGMPILWHIMKIYSAYGINDFIICLGHKGHQIKNYFANYFLYTSDVTFDIAQNTMTVHEKHAETWKVTLVDTGETTMTGGRLKRVRSYLGDDDFCFTYGDGLSDINIKKLIQFHKTHGKLATVTAVKPTGRFGAVEIEDHSVISFNEKPLGDGAWINGGFFILSPKVIDLIRDDSINWEEKPMQQLVKAGQLEAYCHKGFWQPMDTLREKNLLESLWQTQQAPWKIWK
ncbi:MAG: glucose-1-phosphate cytidylyltransferase [Gammaproteobacteria bacterium RIFCSPHIGHO2_12_FULL_40_19]|nr:MAG: glucose-1-phosphate cytidylyltransferase [Gammaproteobacteria bacterium RIFCSPHIGHO2_12_FULL_40_19]